MPRPPKKPWRVTPWLVTPATTAVRRRPAKKRAGLAGSFAAGETPAASLRGVPFSAPTSIGVTWGDSDLLSLGLGEICPSPAGPPPAVIRLMRPGSDIGRSPSFRAVRLLILRQDGAAAHSNEFLANREINLVCTSDNNFRQTHGQWQTPHENEITIFLFLAPHGCLAQANGRMRE